MRAANAAPPHAAAGRLRHAGGRFGCRGLASRTSSCVAGPGASIESSTAPGAPGSIGLDAHLRDPGPQGVGNWASVLLLSSKRVGQVADGGSTAASACRPLPPPIRSEIPGEPRRASCRESRAPGAVNARLAKRDVLERHRRAAYRAFRGPSTCLTLEDRDRLAAPGRACSRAAASRPPRGLIPRSRRLFRRTSRTDLLAVRCTPQLARTARLTGAQK